LSRLLELELVAGADAEGACGVSAETELLAGGLSFVDCANAAQVKAALDAE